MPRVERPNLDPVYLAARQFVERVLLSDDSVFTPGEAIWTLENVREFHRLFVDNVDESSNSFNDKLLNQLDGASVQATQLAAELMFFHSLGVSNQGPVSKLAMFERLLDRIQLEFPPGLRSATAHGIAHHGAGLSHRDAYVRFLARFMLAWKQLDDLDRSRLVSDSGALRDFTYAIPPDADAAQRNMILHLIDPDDFEPMALSNAKDQIVETFADLVSDHSADVDVQLREIREALSGKYGPRFNFYDNDIKRQWGTVPEPEVDEADPVDRLASLAETAFPDPDLRELLLNLLATSIEWAHNAGRKSWGVSSDTRQLSLNLNVGRLATLRISADEVMLALDVPSLDATVINQLDEVAIRDPGSYNSLSTSRYWIVPPDQVPALLDQVMAARRKHIENAATAVAVSPYARSHSAAAVEFLSGVVGRELPFPEHRQLPEGDKLGWDGFVAWAARMFDSEQFDREERDYKLEIGERIALARAATLANADDWPDLLQTAFTRRNNLTPWQQHSAFYGWAHDDPAAARAALEAIWSDDADPLARVRAFSAALPNEIVSGTGTRLAIASFLLMHEPTRHPIYRPTPFQEAWRMTGWPAPSSDSDEADVYQSALAFMDELRTRLDQVGVTTRDRLDAQGLIWTVAWNEPPQFLTSDERQRLQSFKSGRGGLPTKSIEQEVVKSYVEPGFGEILDHFREADFRIKSDTLHRFHLSLKTRGFVILSGLSGTGKSLLTRLYAEAVDGEFCLVPVAPNWTTNEDLLGYHNPVTDTYVDTEFTRFLRRAADAQAKADEDAEPSRPFYFVLDEMNLARVEYYLAKFLSVMESRQDAKLELSEREQIALPANLYAIGTVNVDETTHGFADKVYDRAQIIELPVTEQDLVDFIGETSYGTLLMNVWRAVAPVAPFAFRVVDEVRRYMTVATDDGLDWQQALDHQVLQKVLPKLARVDERVGFSLQRLGEVCGETLPLSRDKAIAMNDNLEAHGFAAYF